QGLIVPQGSRRNGQPDPVRCGRAGIVYLRTGPGLHLLGLDSNTTHPETVTSLRHLMFLLWGWGCGGFATPQVLVWFTGDQFRTGCQLIGVGDKGFGGVRGATMRSVAWAALAAAGVALLARAASADTLEWALVQAYQNNPQLNAQRASLRAQDEAVPQALSGYRPRVT